MRIEYEDKEILVVYKEAGLPVQSGRTSARDLVSLLKNHLSEEASSVQPQTGPGSANARKGTTVGEPYLGIIHRLDQPVEGLLVFAKTPKAAADLSRQAASKGDAGDAGRGDKAAAHPAGPDMEKIYRAVVMLSQESFPLALRGRKEEITLTDWILRDYAGNTALIVEEGTKDAKRAQLTFRTLEIKGTKAMLEIRLHTGRHHQIRVQMAHAGMPLAGDRKYGSAAGPEDGSLCLCAARLGFRHPKTGKRMTFEVQPGFSL